MIKLLQNGPDYTSLLGSNIAENSLFYFVSANGYNVFNGIVYVYFKNLSSINNHYNKNHENIQYKYHYIKPFLHSVINVRETLNSNFGLVASANDQYLAIGAISYNIYNGAIFLYKFHQNYWIYYQKIQDTFNANYPLLGFGIHILMTNNSRLIVSNFHNEISLFTAKKDNEYFVQANKINNSYIDTDFRFLVEDNYNNIIASYLTNQLFIY